MIHREKLIELLNVDMSGCVGDFAEEMADYLVANGVRVPVQCDQCRFSIDEDAEGWLWCDYWNSGTEFYSYCHHGERKDNEY